MYVLAEYVCLPSLEVYRLAISGIRQRYFSQNFMELNQKLICLPAAYCVEY